MTDTQILDLPMQEVVDGYRIITVPFTDEDGQRILLRAETLKNKSEGVSIQLTNEQAIRIARNLLNEIERINGVDVMTEWDGCLVDRLFQL